MGMPRSCSPRSGKVERSQRQPLLLWCRTSVFDAVLRDLPHQEDPRERGIDVAADLLLELCRG